MRLASAGLQALFAARKLPRFVADLFTITLADGTIYRWSTSDIALSVLQTQFITAMAATAPGGSVLTLGTGNSPMQPGWAVADLTTPAALVSGTAVQSFTPQSITLTLPVESPGVGQGDLIEVSQRNVWVPQGPLVSRSSLSMKNTIEVPELKLKLSASAVDLIENIAIKTALHNGLFDAARVQLERCFMPTPGDTSLGTVLLFNGRVGQIQITALGATVTCKGDVVLMNQYAPTNLYETTCIHQFCDTGCTLNALDFTNDYQIGPGATNSSLPNQSSGWPANPNVFLLGRVTILTGPAAGQSRKISAVNANGIGLAYPLYAVPNQGDVMMILQGCDKNLQDGSGQSCADRANTQNYRGFPYIPPIETGV